MLLINVNKNDNKVVVATEGTIDTETAPKLSEALLDLDYNNLDLTIDFDKTDYITSAGLRALLVARKKLSETTMHIINVNEMIDEVFRITGFSNILTYTLKETSEVDCHLSFKELLKKRTRFSAT